MDNNEIREEMNIVWKKRLERDLLISPNIPDEKRIKAGRKRRIAGRKIESAIQIIGAEMKTFDMCTKQQDQENGINLNCITYMTVLNHNSYHLSKSLLGSYKHRSAPIRSYYPNGSPSMHQLWGCPAVALWIKKKCGAVDKERYGYHFGEIWDISVK